MFGLILRGGRVLDGTGNVDVLAGTDFVGIVTNTRAEKLLKVSSLPVAVTSGAPPMTEIRPRDQHGGSRG